MSYFGTDPGDMTPDEMYGRDQADGVIVNDGPCRGCHVDVGTIDTEIMDEEGACVFGCGGKVDADFRVCRKCQDNSANEWECPVCGTMYADWSGQWEKRDAA